MIKRVMLFLILAMLLAAAACGESPSQVTFSLDSGNIHNALYMPELLVIPITGTPRSVPTSDILYRIELQSREGYTYGAEYVGWSKGESPTTKSVIFMINSGDASASHVYQQLRADLLSGNTATLKSDAANLLKIRVTKA